ncbi:hypothetical protein R1sor_010389 [Riccia sorocarpa]|uniref:Uncharacterized protein n=1 Tax=Riccia sorocarpa TaxID=122646 RepID=A0ABD3HXY8_9MARC
MAVFVSQQTMDSLLARFPYLVEKTMKAEQEVRRVAQLDWRVIQTSCSTFFEAFGLLIIPLPVMHGEDCLSLGFLFGKNFGSLTFRMFLNSCKHRATDSSGWRVWARGAENVMEVPVVAVICFSGVKFFDFDLFISDDKLIMRCCRRFWVVLLTLSWDFFSIAALRLLGDHSMGAIAALSFPIHFQLELVL